MEIVSYHYSRPVRLEQYRPVGAFRNARHRENTVMSVFTSSGRKIPPGSFSFRLISLMQAYALEGGH